MTSDGTMSKICFVFLFFGVRFYGEILCLWGFSFNGPDYLDSPPENHYNHFYHGLKWYGAEPCARNILYVHKLASGEINKSTCA